MYKYSLVTSYVATLAVKCESASYNSYMLVILVLFYLFVCATWDGNKVNSDQIFFVERRGGGSSGSPLDSRRGITQQPPGRRHTGSDGQRRFRVSLFCPLLLKIFFGYINDVFIAGTLLELQVQFNHAAVAGIGNKPVDVVIRTGRRCQ